MTAHTIRARTPDGRQAVATTPAKVGSPLFPVGIAEDFTLPLTDGYGDVDVTMIEDRYLNGATGEVWGDFTAGKNGTYVEFFVVASNEQIVGQFGEKLYFPPDGKLPLFISQESTLVPAGFKLRARIYDSASSGTIKLVGWIWTYKEPA
jgi:hypothetical protein